MTDEEIYRALVRETPDFSFTKEEPVKDFPSFFRLLLLAQLSDHILEDAGFFAKEEEFKTLFCGYDPHLIKGKHQYTALLKEVLGHFKPERKGPYKEITQAAFLTARYLASYPTFEDYVKDLYLTCKDEESTMHFLDDFRKKSGLFGMFFAKSAAFFQKSGLLDVPVTDSLAKVYLCEKAGLSDVNFLCYRKLLSIAKGNNISCAELNARITAASLRKNHA
jgi:hypothetical protein